MRSTTLQANIFVQRFALGALLSMLLLFYISTRAQAAKSTKIASNAIECCESDL
jgi:hypothetical protein